MEQMLFLVPVVGLLGLLFAVILRQQVVKEDPGTDKMREIADAIAEGANAFLASEYLSLIHISAYVRYMSLALSEVFYVPSAVARYEHLASVF